MADWADDPLSPTALARVARLSAKYGDGGQGSEYRLRVLAAAELPASPARSTASTGSETCPATASTSGNACGGASGAARAGAAGSSRDAQSNLADCTRATTSPTAATRPSGVGGLRIDVEAATRDPGGEAATRAASATAVSEATVVFNELARPPAVAPAAVPPADAPLQAPPPEAPLHFPLATAEEAAQVAEMRALLAPQLEGVRCAAWEDVTGDIRMLRFLQGYEHDVAVAAENMREMLAVRVKERSDDVHERWAHGSLCSHTSGLPHQEAVQRLMPSYATVGIAPSGHPVCYNPLGKAQYREVLREIGEGGYLEFYVAQCEARMAQLHELSVSQRQMVKVLLVIDVRDISVWALSSRAWSSFNKRHLHDINKGMAEAYARIYVINAPTWLTAFYNKAVKWMLPERTQRKLFFLAGPSQYGPALEAVLDGETLASLHALIGEPRSRGPRGAKNPSDFARDGHMTQQATVGRSAPKQHTQYWLHVRLHQYKG